MRRRRRRPSAALARAKAALDKGDLAAAVKEVETLDGAAREAFSAWLGQARARLSADETLEHARKRPARVLRRPSSKAMTR